MSISRRNSGMTLIEVLVVSVLLALVLGIISRFFISQSRAAALQKAINEATNGARIALTLLSWDIQNAGYNVNTSLANPAIAATNNGHQDSVVIRYHDLEMDKEQIVEYDIGSDPISLRRRQFDVGGNPSIMPSVATIVAMNLTYETRQNQFITPVGSGSSKSCPGGAVPVPDGATGAAIMNCLEPWAFAGSPQRLVRRVRVELLARSNGRAAGYSSSQSSYSFADGSSYEAEDGYVYHYAEQFVLTPNLNR